MKTQFDLVVFDWDGTLFDSIPWIVECLQVAASQCGFAAPSDAKARSVIGLSLDRALDDLFPGLGEDAVRLASAYKAHYGRRHIGADGLFDGVGDMLEALRGAGYRLAVATGKTRSGLSHALAATGTSALFDAVRCPEQSASKPDPAMLHQLMQELDVPPLRTLMVGDSVHDMQMAVNAGIRSVAVACGANSLPELRVFGPVLCLEHTAQLAPMLM